MALSRADDQGRFDKAAPHIQALLECPEPRSRVGPPVRRIGRPGSLGRRRETTTASPCRAQRQRSPPSCASSAVRHLKIAAAQLPEIAEAQARYGVALVLAGEQNLGRQFLQTALRLGSLDSQYQLWAAWTILQAGYPEEAEPIVAALLRASRRRECSARAGRRRFTS